MYANSVKIHDQDALAISGGVWCEVIERRERLTCGPGSKAMPRRAFFLSMQTPDMRGVPGRMQCCSVVCGAAARGGDAKRTCRNDCWKGPSRKIVPRRFASRSMTVPRQKCPCFSHTSKFFTVTHPTFLTLLFNHATSCISSN